MVNMKKSHKRKLLSFAIDPKRLKELNPKRKCIHCKIKLIGDDIFYCSYECSNDHKDSLMEKHYK